MPTELDSILDDKILEKITDDDYEDDDSLEKLTFEDIFEPDYLKENDTKRGKIHETFWIRYVTRRVKEELKKIGNDQIGTVFIRRRMIVHGLGQLEEKNKEKIEVLRENYKEKIYEEYNPLKMQIMDQKLSFGDKNGIKVDLYLDENTFARIEELADIFSVTKDVIERMAVAYTIIELKKYVGDKVIEVVETEIKGFGEYIRLRK